MTSIGQAESTSSSLAEFYSTDNTNLLSAAGSITAATIISRVLAVGREMIMSGYFGAGYYTDAFNIAFRIPNLLRDLFAEGALSSAFVPTLVRRLTEKGKEEAWLLASRVTNALAIVLSAITLLFYFGARWFVFLFAGDLSSSPGKFELTVQMTRIMSPFLLCVEIGRAHV